MKHTKKALLSSVLSVLLCCSMLIGSTFAWFTDSVTSGKNKIVAGNLDVELEYMADDGTWHKVTEATELFSSMEADGETENLWEPGHTEVVYLRISNVGSLALKYQLTVTVNSETTFTNALGAEDCKLSNYLVFGQKESEDKIDRYTDREAAWKDAGSTLGLGRYAKPGTLLPKDDTYVALIVYMPTTVGNEANYRASGTDDVPQIDLGIALKATQAVDESDSFGNDYDKDAAAELIDWTDLRNEEFEEEVKDKLENPETEPDKVINVSSAAELAAIADIAGTTTDGMKGWTIKITEDIDLSGANWSPIGGEVAFQGTIDGEKTGEENAVITGLTMHDEDGNTAGFVNSLNYGTIKNLTFKDAKVTGDTKLGVVVGGAFPMGTVENVTVEGAELTGCHYVGGILGQGYCSIKNCTVKDITIYIEPHMVDSGEYDDGDKAGALAGQVTDGSYEISGNTVDGAVLTGYRDIGGLIGHSHNQNKVTDNTVKNVQITVSNKNDYGHSQNAGEILGNREFKETETGNTFENVTITWSDVKDEGALEEAAKGGNVNVQLGEDITFTNPTGVETPNGSDVTVDGNGNTLTVTHTAFNNYDGLEGINDGTLNFKNIVFEGAKSDTLDGQFAVVLGFDSRVDVVFENCTFDNLYDAVYCNPTTGDTVSHVTFKNCTFKNVKYGVGIDGTSVEGSYVVTYDSCTGLTPNQYSEFGNGVINLKGSVNTTLSDNVEFEGDGMEVANGSDVTMDGGNHTVNVEHTAFNNRDGLEGINEGTLHLSNIVFEGDAAVENGQFAAVIGFNANVDIVFEGCTFKNLYAAVCGNPSESADNHSNIIFRNCKFENTKYGVSIDPKTVDGSYTVTFENCTGLTNYSEFNNGNVTHD